MNELAAHRSLALAIARDFFLPGADRDDVEQEAMIALLEAARSYRPEEGASFRTFAKLVIRRRLFDAIAAANREKHRPLTERLDHAIATEDGDVLSILDAVPAPASDPARIVEDREEAFRLLRIVREELSPLERRAVIALANGLSYEEAAEYVRAAPAHTSLRASRPTKTVDNALARARRKLADPFEVAA